MEEQEAEEAAGQLTQHLTNPHLTGGEKKTDSETFWATTWLNCLKFCMKHHVLQTPSAHTDFCSFCTISSEMVVNKRGEFPSNLNRFGPCLHSMARPVLQCGKPLGYANGSSYFSTVMWHVLIVDILPYAACEVSACNPMRLSVASTTVLGQNECTRVNL